MKIYYPNGIYHVYNRGVEKRDIFLENNDYVRFLHLLKTALLPPELLREEHENQGATLLKTQQYRPRKNFFGKIKLICYCLEPNHFHFLVQQVDGDSLTQFIHSLCTAYSMNFNQKYQRVGSLFQGIFKAANIDDENYLLWVSRYIHRNPVDFKQHPYTSYDNFLGKKKTEWLYPELVLDCFQSVRKSKESNYQEFVEAEKEDPVEISSLWLE